MSQSETGFVLFDPDAADLPAYWRPVSVAMPGDQGSVRHRIDMRLQWRNTPDLQELARDNDALDPAEWGGADDPLMALVRDWREGHVRAPDGAAIPFTADNLARLLRIAVVRGAIWSALYDLATGQDALEKNSATSPAPGRKAGGRGRRGRRSASGN